MPHDNGMSPGFTVALALAVGMVAQSLARHVRLPGIVMLLGAGVLLGPDVLGVLRPERLGEGLHVLVEFAVAVILFEGGLNLDWRRLRREGATIRRLVSLGAIVTAVGGTVATRLILNWDWRTSILFGTLVVVTGPTVITPLLRRIKVKHNLETVLEAEGVFIDAVGALLAVVALEVALSPTGSSLALGFVDIPTRLVFGVLFGVAGGVVIALLLRFRGLVPEGLENITTLALALALYQTSNFIMTETGIVSVVTAGLVVGNAKTPVHKELKEFKEQLTVMLIGLLFVLLAADVRLADLTGLGWGRGLLVVLCLMFVVRPLNVILCTVGTGMTWRERAFLSWLAPRGIVAAAIASLFYTRLTTEGHTGGEDLRALVFLVIAVTVVFQGTTGAVVARWLGVRRPMNQGYVILGAHDLACALGRLLEDGGEDVVLLDAKAESCRQAEEHGFKAIYGNALEERVLRTAELESRRGAIGTLPNEAVNLLFAQKARDEYKVPRVYVAIQRGHGSIDPDLVHQAGGRVLFAGEADLELWSVRLRRGIVNVERWRLERKPETAKEYDGRIRVPKEMQNLLLPVTVHYEDKVRPLHDGTRVDTGHDVSWLVLDERAEEAHKWLTEQGWTTTVS